MLTVNNGLIDNIAEIQAISKNRATQNGKC